MLIILEGGDRCGKSTLANNLKTFGFKYFHNDPPKTKDVFLEYLLYWDEIFNKYDPSVNDIVIDRYFHSELVYSKFFKRESNFTFDSMKYIEKKIITDLGGKRPTVIYCENDLNTNFELVNAENEGSIKSKEDILFLRNEFYKTLHQSLFNITQYNYNLIDTSKFISQLLPKNYFEDEVIYK